MVGNTRAVAAAVLLILPAAAALLMSARSRPRPKRRERKATYTAANPLRCHVLRHIRPEDRVLLSKLLNDNVQITCVAGNSPEQCTLPEGDERVDILVHGFKGEIVSKLIKEAAASRELSAFMVPFAGVETSIVPALKEAGVTCFNSHHNAPIAAEMAVSLLLAACKQTVTADADLRQGIWTRRGLPLPGTPDGVTLSPLEQLTLEGGVAVVVGIRGRIGQRVALSLAAMGMVVVGTSASVTQECELELGAGGASSARAVARVYPANMLHELLGRARAVVVAAPGTEGNRHLIGPVEIEAITRGSSGGGGAGDGEEGRCVLVNIGRGPCVDGDAVFDALDAGKLFAFASDVWYNYPKTYDDANGKTPPTTQDVSRSFADVRGATLSGHRGGAPMQKNTEYRRWLALTTALNLAAEVGTPKALADAPGSLIGEVSLAKGY